MRNMENKNTHGGKRPGAGRPKKEPTTVIRVPVSLVQAIKELIKKADSSGG
jgi:hypothetical protein